MRQVIQLKNIVLVLAIFSAFSFGQTPEKLERELIGHLKNIEEWTMINDRTGEDVSEKLDKERATFRAKLLKNTKRPSVLRFGFNDLAKHMYISTSPDGKFRIYSWDTLTGGTMHFFDNVYQYQCGDGKTHSKGNSDEGNAGAFYTGISQLDTRSGRIYPAMSQSVLSTSYNGQTIRLFKIKRRSLTEDVNLIKTRSRLTNSISFAYDFFSVADRKERPIKLIKYDRKSRTIRFPVVVENKKYPQGEVTNRWISYRFNGKYFVKITR
jgi:hypothetical protein